MKTPWLNIIGIGENGVDGLSTVARDLVQHAEVIIGGDRHHNLVNAAQAERVAWPSPFDAMIDKIKSYKGKRVVVLVTGDPLWYSVGARITKSIDPSEITFHPQLSAFQWASARMGWSLADVETLTVHGRAAEQIVPYFAPGMRLLVLTKDKTSVPDIAQLLLERGYGPSKMKVLAGLGGVNEAHFDMTADQPVLDVPDFYTLAIECIPRGDVQLLPRTGLPDDAFVHDGKMTKRAVRALALAKLVPIRGQMLWDIGCGCGSIAIEWMRGAPEAHAIGFEFKPERRNMALQNARILGVPKLQIVDGKAPDCLSGQPAPDAVFIGGGLCEETIVYALEELKPYGRLVAHAVTLESEAVLLKAYEEHGGEMQRISVDTSTPVGPYEGWKPSMPVMQWSWEKRQ